MSTLGKRTAVPRASKVFAAMTTGEALAARQAAVALANRHGLWLLLFTLTEANGDWVFALDQLRRESGEC